ncbi:MAG: T9SS type A sorting domain-containing protein [Candidatus Zixiibacteriota bacterium]
MRKFVLISILISIIAGLFAWDYDSGVIDVRTDPRASGGERRFLPYYLSVCIDQPPVVVDLDLPPGDYSVDAYLRYYPCEQEHETMYASLGGQSKHIPDMGCTSFQWFYNIGDCGADCGGDPSPLNYHTVSESSDLVLQGSGWTAEGVNVIYVRVFGNYRENTPPIVTELTPENGEFADNITIDAISSDPDSIVVSEEFEYSLDGETWLPITISDNPEDPILWTSELDECEVWLRARAFDGELYSEWFVSGPILIDNTPPVTSDDAPEGWQIGEVTVNLTADDGECGSGFDGDGTIHYSIEGFDYFEGNEILFIDNGSFEIQYYSVDDVGNTEEPKTCIVMIDNLCPVFTELSIPEFDEDFEGDLPISITVEDEHSGVLEHTEYYAIGVTETPHPDVVWIEFSGTIDEDWPMFEGQYLYVKSIAEDNAGNVCESEIQSEYIDPVNHPPLVISLLPEEGEFKDDIEVSAETEDPDGPVIGEIYEYSLDGESWLPLADTETPDIPIIWTSGLNECEVWLRVRAFDGELYSEWFVEGPILIDNTAPTTTDNAPEGWQNTDITVLLSPDDAICGSGFDGTGTTYLGTEGAYEEGTEVEFTETGTYEISYYSIDDVGNEEIPNSFTVSIDKDCPIFADWSIPEIDEDYEEALEISLAVSDEHSGVASYATYYAFSIDDSPDPEALMWTEFDSVIDVDWSLHENEYLYVKAIGEDNAGNICDSDMQSEFIEYVNHPPIITALVPENGEFADNIEISATTSDPDGPVAAEEYEYSLDGETWLPITISDTPADPYSWASGLDECEVWLRARAYDGELYSDWLVSGPILIDNTPPVTTDDAPEGWQVDNFVVILTPDDGECGSGFDGDGTTYYSIDDGAILEGNEIEFTESGVYEISYFSVDDVGNSEEPKTTTVYIDKDCVTFSDWNIPDISGGTVDETCINYTGREGIEYTVISGTDPTCGLTGIKFEDGSPNLGEDSMIEADIFQFTVMASDIPAIIEISTKAGGVCGYSTIDIDECSSSLSIGDICEAGSDEGGFIIQLLDMEDLGSGEIRMTWRVVSDDEPTAALSHVVFGILPVSPPSSYSTIGDYEICFGGGVAECDTFTGRGGMEYVVEIGTDPTCGLTGIKYEDAEPGLGEDGALEADIYQFNIPSGTLPATIEVSTKAGRTCGYTVFNTSDCGLLAGEGGICEAGPDEGGFIVQFLAIEEYDAYTTLTFRVISDEDNRTAALSHVTFGLPSVEPMSDYTTPSEFVICDESDEVSCESFSVTISDELSGVDESASAFYWAISPSATATEPDELSWTPIAEGSSELIGEICAAWNENSGEYIYFMAEGSDLAGNSCYEMINEYIEPVTETEPEMEGCGYGVTFEFPSLFRAHSLIGYNVYRSDAPFGDFTKVTDEPVLSTSFSDGPAPGLWYYKVMKVYETLEEIQYGDIYEVQTYDITSNNLGAKLLEDSQVELSWNSSPEASSYEIYMGRGEDVLFDTPIASVYSDTIWTSPSGMLEDGINYSFYVKAITDCDCPYENRSNILTVMPTNQPLLRAASKARITSPKAGSFTTGDYLTVSAEPIFEHVDDISSLRFQIRSFGRGDWIDLSESAPIVDMPITNTNPDNREPYFINIDTEELGTGKYQIRAINPTTSPISEIAPMSVTFNIDPSFANIDENLTENSQDIVFTAAPGRIVDVSLGTSSSNILIKSHFTISSEACRLNIKNISSEILPEPSPDSRAITAFRTSRYSGPKPDYIRSSFDIYYDESEIVARGLREENLRVYCFRTGGFWEPLPTIVDPEKNIVHTQTEEFGLFILGPAELLGISDENNLPKEKEIILAHPNPFNSQVTIITEIPDKYSELSIYNILGQKLRTFDTKNGINQITWDGCDDYGKELSSGIYLLHLSTKDRMFVEKLILMK